MRQVQLSRFDVGLQRCNFRFPGGNGLVWVVRLGFDALSHGQGCRLRHADFKFIQVARYIAGE